MENPRAEKVAIVDEVRERLDDARAVILTEYRGLTVRELADLRHALTAAGSDYKVYKNTLVKLAIAGGRHEPLDALLSGPTAIAFVSGEVSAVAKALRDYARTNPALVLKGGHHDEGFLTAQDLGVLADLPPRDVMLARLAGGLAAPLQQLAGLLQAVTRNFAYGLSALLDQKGGAPAETAEAPSATDESAAPAETVVEAPAETQAPDAAAPEAEAAEAQAPPASQAAPEGAAETAAPDGGDQPEASDTPSGDGE